MIANFVFQYFLQRGNGGVRRKPSSQEVKYCLHQLHCCALQCSVLHCSALPRNALHCATLHCATLISATYTALHYGTLKFTTLHFATLNFLTLTCAALHCTRVSERANLYGKSEGGGCCLPIFSPLMPFYCIFNFLKMRLFCALL